MRVVSQMECRARLEHLMDEVLVTHEEIVVRRNDRADVVLMGLDDFLAVLELARLLEPERAPAQGGDAGLGRDGGSRPRLRLVGD